MNQMSVILYILAMGEVTSGGMDKEGQHHRNYLVGEAKKSYINVHVNVGSIKNGKNCKTPRDKTSMEETSPLEETSSSVELNTPIPGSDKNTLNTYSNYLI